MNVRKTQEFRRRLLGEHDKLIESLGRSRVAEDEIRVEKTEDEADMATMSHEKDVLYSLHESDFARLRSIQSALNALDSGKYGECVRCSQEISEKRLLAVPWATTCIYCQEATEAERVSGSRTLPALD